MTDPYRIRSTETWAKARDDYLSGLAAEAVCRRYDLGLRAFRRRARKYGWRRMDQDDPAPRDDELDIYDDLILDDHVEMARLRFSQALAQGRPIQAARWRRLWLTLREELNEFDAQFYAGLTLEERCEMLDAMEAEDETAEEVALLSAPGPENVHDVHSNFLSAHSPPGDRAPDLLLSRAERRRQAREARRRPALTPPQAGP